MSTTGRLDRIWIKRYHRGPMDAVERADLHAGRGLAGNANQGGRRQITLIARGRWDHVNEALADDVDPVLRRANVLVSGIDLAHTRGRVLRLGACRLRINGETRPCERMDEAWPGLRSALEPQWRGGVYAEVLDDGEIAVGDVVAWETSTDVQRRRTARMVRPGPAPGEPSGDDRRTRATTGGPEGSRGRENARA